jgi:RNA polymerase sigma-70 factor (ECF subfamily)
MPSEAPHPTDEELIAAALAGDQGRFGDLVERYQGRLVNYLYRLVRDLDEAHELAQEAFLKVYQALDRYNPEYKFSTWLFRVAQNTAIDQIRKRRIRLVSMQRPVDAEGEAREWDLAGDDPGPYRRLRNRERGAAMQEAIDALPWEYRELILLRHFGELSYDEIAGLKKMPLGTVKNKLFRARQMLKGELREFLED